MAVSKTAEQVAAKPLTKRSGIREGANKGHATTPRALKQKPSYRKGQLGKRVAFVRGLIREVAGFAPYEKRIMEFLKNNKDKRARKLAKRRLGTYIRGKRKVEELSNVLVESRRAAGH